MATARHKHADVIIAWANGAQIQWLDTDVFVPEWRDVVSPDWSLDIEYRVKPEPKKYVVIQNKETKDFSVVRENGWNNTYAWKQVSPVFELEE